MINCTGTALTGLLAFLASVPLAADGQTVHTAPHASNLPAAHTTAPRRAAETRAIIIVGGKNVKDQAGSRVNAVSLNPQPLPPEPAPRVAKPVAKRP